MDKNLKKLSRVELLQLMVQLSEDRDALFAENTELRKRAAERPAAATSMKVGSIAEAALQANGYFESAQNAAERLVKLSESILSGHEIEFEDGPCSKAYPISADKLIR